MTVCACPDAGCAAPPPQVEWFEVVIDCSDGETVYQAKSTSWRVVIDFILDHDHPDATIHIERCRGMLVSAPLWREDITSAYRRGWAGLANR